MLLRSTRGGTREAGWKQPWCRHQRAEDQEDPDKSGARDREASCFAVLSDGQVIGHADSLRAIHVFLHAGRESK